MILEPFVIAAISVFWISSFLVVYPYIGYPLLLLILNYNSSKVVGNRHISDTYQPTVVLLISAFNEAEVISTKISSSLKLDYPPEKLKIYVVSDASNDGTDEIVKEWADRDSRVFLVRQPVRKGKSSGINLAMSNIDADIVVFSDANAIYQSDALTHLLANFENPDVGYVVGTARYLESEGEAAKDGEGIYWKYELWIKKLESSFHSVVGGDGAIYAIRRQLFWPFLETDINDFVNPLQIIAKGYLGVFTDQAVCFEEASSDYDKEFRRKRRIVNRSWTAVLNHWKIFSFRSHAKFLFMLVSHKIIRWFSFLFVLLALISSAFIASVSASKIYLFFFSAIALSIVGAMVGRVLIKRNMGIPGAVNLLYYFYLVGIAGMLGIIDSTRGINHSTWAHNRK